MSYKQENKNYVTPYAFGVNDTLLGKALASPTRRLCSILVDTLVVGSLTLMSATVMAACFLIVSIVGSIKARRKNARDGTESMAATVLSVAAVISGIVLAASLLIGGVNLDMSTDSTEIPVEVDKGAVEENSDSKAEPQQEPLSIIAWLQAGLADLGIGFGWAALYFSVFTAWFHGQTLGKILFRIRVLKIDGDELSLWQSFERYGGYSAGLATGLLGFLQIIWDPNRQAIHDKISETVVIDLRKPDRALNAKEDNE